MATDYEKQRLLNIARNKELLNRLALAKTKIVVTSTTLRPPKRLKPKPSPSIRSSSRLSNKPRPPYLEDVIKLPPSSQPLRKLPSLNPNPPTVTEPEDFTRQWGWEATAVLPTRDDNGTLHFEDYPEFLPNLIPEEIIRQGAFGASYYRPVFSKTLSMTIPADFSDLPPEWISGLLTDQYLTRPTPVPSVNKFRVLCGQSIEEWEAAGWINYKFDPRGWFQWYTRFYQGRRCEDDARQVGRWRRCVGPTGRWKRILLKRYKEKGIRDAEGDDAEDVSPVVHQTCHHWAYQITQDDLDELWAS